MQIGKLNRQYMRTKEQVEDLCDAWTQSLRRKKAVQRKEVCSLG